VDRQARGIRLGGALLQDAVKRAIGVSADAGIRALLVHALSEDAREFYVHYGFRASTLHPMTLMLRVPAR
jgi:GNAT superfamily N-acetyltransferase